uniref:Uncharacterized protein n=1 Tax=Arion vulgaris TaxID=1028688 RepID=A0A0B7BFI6_9EUPU
MKSTIQSSHNARTTGGGAEEGETWTEKPTAKFSEQSLLNMSTQEVQSISMRTKL